MEEEEDWGFARRHARTALSYSFICVGGEKKHTNISVILCNLVFFFLFIIVQKKSVHSHMSLFVFVVLCGAVAHLCKFS